MTVKKLIELLDEYKRLTHQVLEDKRVILNWNENHYGITLFSHSLIGLILFAEKSVCAECANGEQLYKHLRFYQECVKEDDNTITVLTKCSDFELVSLCSITDVAIVLNIKQIDN